MQLYKPDKSPLLDIEVSDESYSFKEIMSRDDLTLYFNMTTFKEMPIDMYCVFQNRKYYLTEESNFQKNGNYNYVYTLILNAPVAYMKKTKFKFVTLDKEPDGSFRLNAPAKAKFSLRGTPSDLLDMLVDCMNLNDKDGGWKKGECIEGVEMTFDINKMFCYDFLADVADKYKTEFDVDDKTIHLKKIETKDFPPVPLSYGKGNGVLYGMERKIRKTPISRVWIESSDRNIDFKSYGFDTLRLPKDRTIIYNGIEYITDSTGSYLERKTPIRDIAVPPEDTVDVIEIYPSHEGTITSVEEIDDKQGLWAFIDSKNVLDYNKLAITGETATIIFQSGELGGSDKEFEFAYDHSKKRFRIKPISDNGMVYPQGTIIPAVGDKYAVFHIKLPQEYIDEAEEKALNELVKYLYENEQPQYTYSITLDQKYAKQHWGEIGDRLNIGYFVHLSDQHFLPEGADIRITSATRYVNRPQMPRIDLSNSVKGSSLYTDLNKIENSEQTVDRKQKEAIQFAKRTWAQSMEMLNAMYDPSGSFLQQVISSVSIHSMMALFGDETLQYQFVGSDWKTAITPIFSFDTETKKFLLPKSNVKHMTLSIDKMQPNRPDKDYKNWVVNQYLSDYLGDADKGYYVYMKCTKSFDQIDDRMTGQADYFISEKEIVIDNIEGYYCLWVGYLSKEFEGDRSFRTVYGYTEILPGQMTVDNIYSSDGNSFLRLLDNQMKFGDDNSSLDWNVSEDKTLTMTNAVVKNALKVKGSAEIAGFRFFNDRIESVSKTTFDYQDWITEKPVSNIYPSIELVGNDGKSNIKMKSVVKSWSPSKNEEIDTLQELTIDSKDGSISLVNGFNETFLNSSGIDVVSTGIDLGWKRSAILGRGIGSLSNDPDKEACIVGVRGLAINNYYNGAPAYGGYFDNAKINGWVQDVVLISGSEDKQTQMKSTNSYVCSESNNLQTVILPTDAYKGHTYWVKQWKSGTIRLKTPIGHTLFDGGSANDYIDIKEGYSAMVVCIGQSDQGGILSTTWLLSKFKM